MRTIAVLCILLSVFVLAAGAAGDPCVRLKYATFDPLIAEPAIPSDLRASPAPGEPAYHIVQFQGPVEPSWRDELGSLGAEILDYLPDFAYVVRMTPEVADQVRGLEHVRWIGLYHPAYCISRELAQSAASEKVAVQFFRGASRASAEADIRALGGAIVAVSSGASGDYLEARVSPLILQRIARHRGISWIERRLERKLCNDVARGIMTVPTAWSGLGLFGAGEVVAVCDTGLDTGSLSTISADFAGRILKTYALGRNNKWNDPNGHGTHVAGSVLGNGVLSGSNPASHNYSTSFAGNAPEAQLVFQSVLDRWGSLGGIPADLNQLFQSPYNDGARIHTNSWGAAYDGVYTTDSHNVDLFTWNKKDMTILFAAGNEAVDADSDGVVDLDSMNSPGTAKNCITVGGSENYRLSGGAQSTYGAYWPTDYPADPIFSDRVSNNSSGMVAFSSRGPCDDGRIKPDVCAPGTNIISCRSHDRDAGTLWGVYNADHLYCGGTSMSAPLAAGAAALVRQFYRTVKSITPTSALIKATLINGAREMSPGQYGTGQYLEIPTRPNNVEGWGRIDLAYSISPASPREVRFADYTAGLSTGGSQIYTYSLTGSASPFRATLVWTDYPAAASASPALVNDLDLVVTMPGGAVRRGNGTTDRTNNVEGVDIASPPTGTYTVTVSAYNVPYGPQPFALVVSGDMAVSPPVAIITAPAGGTTLYGSVTITGTATAGGAMTYQLEYGVGPSPSSWIPIGPPQTTPVTNGVLGIWNTSGLANGQYTIRLTVQNVVGNAYATQTINVLKTSISQVKGNPNGTSVTLTGKVVSAGKQEMGDAIYVQEPDRSSGLKVYFGAVQTGAVIADLVTVSGTLGTSNGERLLNNPSAIVTGSTSAPDPLGMVNRTVGGWDYNQYTPGVTGGTDLYNIGILIATWGKVTALGSDCFYMDDGCGLSAAGGNKGIKVYTGSLTKPVSTQYVSAIGISSTEIVSGVTYRVLRPRGQSDLVYY